MKRFAEVQVFLAVALPLLFVCSNGCKKQEPQAEGIKVGVVTSLTGNTASWGDMQRKATTLALEDINSNNGVNGRLVEAVFEDDQGIPKVGVSAFEKLIATTDVPIIVGFPLSGVTLAASDIANRRKVIILSSGSTATAVGKAGPYVFRIMPSDELQATIMAEWALRLGYRRVAVLYVENIWGTGLKENFIRTFSAKGGVITDIESSADDTSDFRSQLTKCSARDPDAIYMPLYQKQAGLAIRQAREIGIQQQILGADVYETPELIEAGGSAVNGVLYTTFSRGQGPAQDEFSRRYKERFGEAPGTYAFYSYDAFRIAVDALKATGGTNVKAESLRASLLSIDDYRGVTGPTSFKGKTSASGKTFDKMTVKDGVFVPWASSSSQ